MPSSKHPRSIRGRIKHHSGQKEAHVTDTHKVPRRDEVEDEYTWDLSTIYADDAAWEQAVAALEAQTPDLGALEGTIAQGAKALLHALTLADKVAEQLWQVYVYAGRRHDSDTTDTAGQALDSRAGSVVAKISAAMAFIEPEILALPDATIQQWLAEEPGLELYRYKLEQLARQRAHVRSAEVENVVAQFGDVARSTSDIFGMLTNADLDFPYIKDESGNDIQLSHARYGRFLESQDRRVRRDTFKGMYSAFGKIRNTLATTLAGEIRSHVVGARIHNYPSALAAALEPNDIPLDVYHNLISTINANLPKLHRYMELRKRVMGLDDLRIYDLYAPMINEPDVVISYAEGAALVRDALAPLGAQYADALQQTFTSRWIDVYENVGKRSGAYSDGSYTTAPFILLNYQDRLNDVFTLAHELGHSMHSFFTRKTQPFVYGNYTIFVAEVASTLNEALLTDYMIKNRADASLKRRLLVQQLEDVRTTIFRQTMFAEFELDMHTRTEQGEPLTADGLSQRYHELVGRYHGPAVVLDDEIALEWARIPHFYYNYYVYQYATGLSAALALSKQIIGEGQPAIDRYLNFLRGGSSKSSIELLRGAGVDMESPAPIQAAMDEFDHLLDELETLV
ncbi:oligoendopeptidase F [Chloroflexia bacterium SDU3-3]|nr:oligoendopeptidase F [Chloroflexia bacterium SDU3-3]